MLFGGLSVLWAARTLSLSGDLDSRTVHRGDRAELRLRVRHRGLLPVAPILLEIVSGEDLPVRWIRRSGSL